MNNVNMYNHLGNNHVGNMYNYIHNEIVLRFFLIKEIYDLSHGEN